MNTVQITDLADFLELTQILPIVNKINRYPRHPWFHQLNGIKFLVCIFVSAHLSCKSSKINTPLSETKKPSVSQKFNYDEHKVYFIVESEIDSSKKQLNLAEDREHPEILSMIIPAIVGVGIGAVATKFISESTVPNKAHADGKIVQELEEGLRIKDLELKSKISEFEFKELQIHSDYKSQITSLKSDLEVKLKLEKELNLKLLQKEQVLNDLKLNHLTIEKQLKKEASEATLKLQRHLAKKKPSVKLSPEFLELQRKFKNLEISEKEFKKLASEKDFKIQTQIENFEIERIQLNSEITRLKLEKSKLKKSHLNKVKQLEEEISQQQVRLKQFEETDEIAPLGYDSRLDPDYENFQISELKRHNEELEIKLLESESKLKKFKEKYGDGGTLSHSLKSEQKALEKSTRMLREELKYLQKNAYTEVGIYTLSEKITAIPYRSVDDIPLINPVFKSRDEAYVVFNIKRTDIIDSFRLKYEVDEFPIPIPDGLPPGVNVIKIKHMDHLHQTSRRKLNFNSQRALGNRGISDYTAQGIVLGTLSDKSTFKMGPKIGSGTFGNVRYVSVFRDTGQQSHFAMKVFKNNDSFNKINTKRLHFEDVLGAHPNLLKCYGNIEDAVGNKALLYEVGGKNLRDLEIDRKLLKNAYNDIFDGVDHIHQRGFVHWDLKPSNFVMGKDGRVKIIDLDGMTPIPSRTKPTEFPKNLAASEAYSGPEVIFKEFDTPFNREKSDVYSIGMSMLEMSHRPESISEIFETVMGRKWQRNDDAIKNGTFFQKLQGGKYSLKAESDLIFQMINPNPTLRPTLAEAKSLLSKIDF